MKVNKHMKQIGSIKDRGIIKWQGMMLAEHVELIRALYDEDKCDPQPNLDKYDLQLLQEELFLVAQRKCLIKMKSWKDKKYYYHIGIIQELNAYSKSIIYKDPSGTHSLPMEELIGVWMID